MATIVFSRRGVQVWPKGAGEYTGMFVPAEDQIVVLRDVAANSDEISQRTRSEGRVPLWREKRGQVLVYGFLPDDLKEISKPLKVYLAEDFAPAGCSAFFFVFGNWAVHGIKEVDDERREIWRSTVLSYATDSAVQSVADAAADLLLRFPAKEIIVAVEGSRDTQEIFKQTLKSIEVASMPFAALRPAAAATPLYQHRDFGLIMTFSVGLLGLVFIGMLAYLLNNAVQSSRLQTKIAEVRQQIQSIRINESIGYIHEPQPVLNEMRKNFQQEPSAILDAGGRFARALGQLNTVAFEVNSNVDNNTTGIMPVTVKFTKIFDKLLVNQENTARTLLPQAPWIRRVAGEPEGTGLQLELGVQISSPKGVNLPSATTVFQPVLAPPAESGQPAPAQPVYPGAPQPMPPQVQGVPAAPAMPVPGAPIKGSAVISSTNAPPPNLPPPPALPPLVPQPEGQK